MIRILVVDDDQDIRQTIVAIFEFGSYEVQIAEARDGREAIDYLESCRPDELPDVIILDLLMPVMNGFEFRAWQMESSFADLRTIVYSAMAWSQHQREMLQIHHIVSKPFRAEVLDAVLDEIAHTRSISRTVDTVNAKIK